MLSRWRLKRHVSKRDYIPVEVIEKILVALPVKSIIRFSTVSRLWNSTISRPQFTGSYRGREMVVLKLLSSDSGFKTLVCPLSSMSSDNPIDEATAFVYPFEFPGSYLASCDHLWCVQVENSLVLYNPSTQTYRQLPNPLSHEEVPVGSTTSHTAHPVFVYGLGYDSLSDDYKILKLHQHLYVDTEIYSLKTDCWTKVESRPPHSPPYGDFLSTKGLFVNEAFHWLLILRFCENRNTIKNVILSFNISEEKFEEIDLPKLPISYSVYHLLLDMIVFGGKLRVYVNHDCCFSVWVMEDYDSKLWTKELQIDYTHIPPLCYSYLKPFYFYDSVGNVVKAVTCSNDMEHIFICEDEDEDGSSTLVEKTLSSKGFGVIDSFTYVESFVALWYESSKKRDKVENEDDVGGSSYDESFVSNSGKSLKGDDVGNAERFVSIYRKSMKNDDDVENAESFV